MILFAYDFPHRKTQDFIFYLNYYNFKLDVVIGAPKELLDIPEQQYHSSVPIIGIHDTREICWKMNIPYFMMGHNSEECLHLLDQKKPKLGLIAGARILKKEVIDKFSLGIINFHPGGIPECRGLDTAHWIEHDNLPVAVTSHFIDGRVDGGWIIKRQEFDRSVKCTLQDIGSLLYYGQLAIFRESISAVNGKTKEDFEPVPKDVKPTYGYFPR